MGELISIRYVVKMDLKADRQLAPDQGAHWNRKLYGRPTEANLARYVAKFVESLDGANDQLKAKLGVTGVVRACIEDQDQDRRVVATWGEPRRVYVEAPDGSDGRWVSEEDAKRLAAAGEAKILLGV